MKNVLVSGADGYIGSNLIRRLVVNNVSVKALTLFDVHPTIPQNELVTCIKCSLDDTEKIADLIPPGEYDAFYHFAWQGVNGSEKAESSIQLHNISMMLNCAQLSKQINCKKFLCAGTIAEQSVKSLEGLSRTSGGMTYGVAKHCAHLFLENYCKNKGINYIWMQFSNIYGPNNRTGNLISYTIDTLKKEQDALFGPAQQFYDFIYDQDLITAIMRLGECENQQNSYFIGSGTPRRLYEYLYEIGTIFGAPERIKIGERPDDGIVYTEDMFDTRATVQDIGNYVSMSFADGIDYTIKKW